MPPHNMYVCPNCGYGVYHPTGFCPQCPSKLFPKAVEHPYNRFQTEKERTDWLEQQGVRYFQETTGVTPLEEQKNHLRRYQLKLEDRIMEMNLALANRNYKLAFRILRGTLPIWQNAIREQQKRIQALKP